MKFSILSITLATTVLGLCVALYVEHSRNEGKISILQAEHEQEIGRLRSGLAIRYSVSDLLTNYRNSKSPTTSQDYEIAAVCHVVNVMDHADFLNQEIDVRSRTNVGASVFAAAGLLEILECNTPEEYFIVVREKAGTHVLLKDLEKTLGLDKAEKREQVADFIERAIQAKKNIRSFPVFF